MALHGTTPHCLHLLGNYSHWWWPIMVLVSADYLMTSDVTPKQKSLSKEKNSIELTGSVDTCIPGNKLHLIGSTRLYLWTINVFMESVYIPKYPVLSHVVLTAERDLFHFKFFWLLAEGNVTKKDVVIVLDCVSLLVFIMYGDVKPLLVAW